LVFIYAGLDVMHTENLSLVLWNTVQALLRELPPYSRPDMSDVHAMNWHWCWHHSTQVSLSTDWCWPFSGWYLVCPCFTFCLIFWYRISCFCFLVGWLWLFDLGTGSSWLYFNKVIIHLLLFPLRGPFIPILKPLTKDASFQK